MLTLKWMDYFLILMINCFQHFAQLEVFGHESRSHGPVTSCTAGKFVTAAVVGGMGDKRGIEAAYKRAISADW